MTATVIEQMLWYLPEVRQAPQVLGGQSLSDIPQIYDPRIETFIKAYKDLGFAWKLVTCLARAGQPMPPHLDDGDSVIFQAYLYACNPQRYLTPAVAGALRLVSPAMANQRNLTEAHLLIKGATYESVAKETGLHPETVQAYEKLFFNIMDRKADESFIAEIVFPHSRLVEMYDGYIDSAPFSAILRRAGYLGTTQELRHFSGRITDVLAGTNPAEARTRLESHFMLNGYLMAKSGWFNQSRHNVGIQNAKSVLMASKAGGEDSGPVSVFATLGQSLHTEIVRVKSNEAKENISRRIGAMKPAQVVQTS